jgi:hypothetical protein
VLVVLTYLLAQAENKGDAMKDFFGIRCNMKVLLIGVGTEV